ncbi:MULTISPECIES: HlyD family secretion protein [unclassified Rhizobium]|uniref:HlyD family secretion protein n=1 Tax=unclassified Rhizobium TaxID=2613769 RepID=UPI001AD96335|nr:MULTISPECIES: HlyD family secretion protein [unclassified Rhizobium]MBO9102036.1 HlyD family secretion protein [Rhizobium sp. L58/93]MBO9170759.1 HlyD family secretion protein [Rhizobium sp. L245/93]MBO9186703.1 HlyD family secretion protein [Rhizobium sp. E27B/91]QXZ86138.1 HlyD family secretion protein [Rhizobium sp. K1/93]QXZ92406.1 HlyD family secretion protein [Rhizobium sp. K15/93]
MASDTVPEDYIPDNAAPTKQRNPLRRIALAVLLFACILFVFAIFMERRTPSSSQATVNAYIIGIAPEVTGRVIEVGVADNTAVTSGQTLFRIDPTQYQLAVNQAEAKLAQVGQSIGASTANVDAVQAKVVAARANRDLKQEQHNRAAELVKRGVYSQAKYDQAKSSLDQADATVVAAEADLRKAEEELGAKGNDNPQLKEALASLERAQLDLLRTTVAAPADGVVTNLQLAVGGMVATGQSAMTFIDAGTVWINAAFKENSLEKVNPGDRAEVLFDVLPGQVFAAKVESIGMGIATGSVDPTTGLPKVSTDTGWVRTPQSFPVRLILDSGRPKGVRYGSQANVVIYTGDHPITNAIGHLWMRFMSVLTYAS